jgi:hypothetical protein
MGSINWQLVRDLEIAKRAGNLEQVSQLSALVGESQLRCRHPNSQKLISLCLKDTETTYRGIVREGDEIVTCLACGKILRSSPKKD